LVYNQQEAYFEYKKNYTDSTETTIDSQDVFSIKVNIIDTSKYYVYSNINENKVYELRKLKNENNKKNYYNIIDSFPKINWIIFNETKEINNYTCVKAKCRFRGRNYTAWFTTEIYTKFWTMEIAPVGPD